MKVLLVYPYLPHPDVSHGSGRVIVPLLRLWKDQAEITLICGYRPHESKLLDGPATAGEIYNIGGTDRISIGELAGRVKELTESEAEIVFVPYDEVYPRGIEEEMFHRAPSIDKIKDAVGWDPSFDLDGILADVIASVRQAQEAESRT